MLLLQRRDGETIHIGDNITVLVKSIQGKRVTLAIEAPRELLVLRGELRDREAAAEPAAQVVQEIDFDPPPGYEIEEFLPNVWHYMFDDGEMSGCTSWRTHNLACLDAWKDYAASLTEGIVE